MSLLLEICVAFVLLPRGRRELEAISKVEECRSVTGWNGWRVPELPGAILRAKRTILNTISA